MNSGTVATGSDGCTCMTCGTRMMLATGAISRNEVVVEFFEQCCIDCCGSADHEERIAVCRRTHDRLYTDIATTAGTVLDEELLTEPLRQQLTNEARGNVVHATGCKWENDAHRPRRIGLCPRDAREHRQRGSAGGQMEKISAGKFHFEPLSLPKTRFVRIDGEARQGSDTQQCLRTARSGVCRVRPCQARGASAPHYSSWRNSKECAEGDLR